MTADRTPVAKFGVGLREKHHPWLQTHSTCGVELFEIITETYIGIGGVFRATLDKLRCDYPMICHGVSLSIGSEGSINLEYLRQAKELYDSIDPLYISDHLSWSTYQKQNSHDLFPIAYTKKCMDAMVAKLDQVQSFLGRQICLENASAYLNFVDQDYDEASFFVELCRRTGVGILFDVNNLYVNHRNLGLDPQDFIDKLDPTTVKYMHLAGHHDRGDVIIDTHDGPAIDEVWQLYRQAVSKFPEASLIFEWDSKIPEFEELAAECVKAKKVHREALAHPPEGRVSRKTTQLNSLEKKHPSNAVTQQHFFREVTSLSGLSADATRDLARGLPVLPEVGMLVLWEGHFAQIQSCFSDIFSRLVKAVSMDGFENLLQGYLQVIPFQSFSLRAEAAKFPQFLRENKCDFDFGVPQEILADIASLEYAICESHHACDKEGVFSSTDLASIPEDTFGNAVFCFQPSVRLVACAYDIAPAVRSLLADEAVAIPEKKATSILVYRFANRVYERSLSSNEALLAGDFFAGKTLEEACEGLVEVGLGILDLDQAVVFAVGKVAEWCGLGLLSGTSCAVSRPPCFRR